MKMNWNPAVLGLSPLAILLGACMHAPFMSHSTAGHSSGGVTLEKETIVNNVRIEVIVPPFNVDGSTMLTLKLLDEPVQMPLRKATAWFDVQCQEDGHGHSSHTSTETSVEADTAAVHSKRFVLKETQPGTYEASFTPQRTGECRFTVCVAEIEGTTFDKPLTLEVTQSVHEGSRTSMMHGSGTGSPTSVLILTSAAMGLMLIGMMLVRGSMF